MYESALLDDAKQQVAALKKADIVVGIPSYRNARTIPEVTRCVAQALVDLLPDRTVLLVDVDANSSDGTTNAFMRVRLPSGMLRFATGYHGLTGHGTQVRAIFEIAGLLRAQACLVLEATLTDLQPEDIRAMLSPVLEGRAHLVIPMHQWSYVDAAFEDFLLYPMLRLMYGQHVRRPLSGDWALSGRLAMALAEQDVWETDAARSGLDVWMIATALASNVPMAKVRSCRKASTLVFGTTAYDQRFTHSTGTLLRHLASHQRLWRTAEPPGPPSAEDLPPPVLDCAQRPLEEFWQGFQQGMKTWRRLHRRILDPEVLAALNQMTRMKPEELTFPDSLWARIVLGFGVCFNKAELDPDKVSASLATPFFARSIALWNQIDARGLECYEELVERQALAFENNRQYLMDTWDSYVAWVPDAPVR